MPDDEQLEFRENPRNVQYTTKAARLLNQTETSVARALSDESEKFLERQYGRLIAVLDFDFTADSYDIGEILIDTLEREFYSDLNKGVGHSFEQAVTAVNQTLADLAADGQNEWVGKLGAVLAVIHENELHLTQVGTAEAFLVRGPTVTRLTEDLSGQTSSANAKTFLNIASGELEVGDKVLLASAELLRHVPERDLRRILYLHPPTRAIRKLADQISGQSPRQLAGVVTELTTIDLISSEPLTDDPDEIILAAPRRHLEQLSRLKSLRHDSAVGEGAAKAKKFYDKRFRPAAERTVAQARHQVSSFIAKRRGQTPPPPPPRPAAGTPEPTESYAKTPSQPMGARAKDLGNQGLDALSSAGRLASKALRPVGRQLKRLWQKSGIGNTAVGRFLVRAVSRLRALYDRLPFNTMSGPRGVLYRNLIILLAVILALSLFASVRGAQGKRHEADVRRQIESVQALQAKAEASFIFKDVEGARRQLAEASKQAEPLRKEKTLKAEVASLQQSLATSYDRINNIVNIPNQPVADFSSLRPESELTQLAQAGTTLYAIGEVSQLYQVAQGTTEVKAAAGVQPGKVKGLGSTSNGNLLILTDKPTVVEFDAKSNAAAEIPVSAGAPWESGVAIDTVQQNGFILEPGKNQIWRHTRTLADFGKGEPYLNAEVDLNGAVDLVTGAQVFALKSDGSVLKFAGGNPVEFKLTAPPGPADKLDDPTSLALNFSTNLIYVLDPKNGRVVEFNEKGEYVRQLRSDAFARAKSLTVDDKTNTLFILADNKLYQFGLGT